MGVSIKGLVSADQISIGDLRGKAIAIDSYNLLYQFLTTIRSPDGRPLSDSRGNPTSHLVGLFNKTSHFIQKGIKPIFVFDGAPPKLKQQERDKRRAAKEEARASYEKATESQDIDGMRKYGARTAHLSAQMISEAKELLMALGQPVIQAPSEGEAQASQIVKDGKAYAAVSQDFDSLLHGAPRLIRNLSIAGRRKRRGVNASETIKPEEIVLQDVLNSLGLDKDQLIILGILVGTDYNPGGVKGIGPKKALALLHKHSKNFDALFLETQYPGDWQEVFDVIRNMPTTSDYSLEWGAMDSDKVSRLLVDGHEFSQERVESVLAKISKEREGRQQKGLSDFL